MATLSNNKSVLKLDYSSEEEGQILDEDNDANGIHDNE